MDCCEYKELLDRKKEIYEKLINFIDSDNDDIAENLHFCEIINNKIDLKEFLHLLSCVLEKHHRTSTFFQRIEQIILFFKENIRQVISNLEIFEIFKNNKKILLFLMKERILTLDKTIYEKMNSYQYQNAKYFHYFFPEVKKFINSKLAEQIEKEIHEFIENNFEPFETNRKIGENELPICNMIRNDLVEDFIAFINRTNTSLSSKINHKSVFETNSFLIDKTPTLIEYSVFFGSIQIFKYLVINNVELNSSLWEYAIYGNNPDIIHLLEENKINCYYAGCFIYSIECHHNNIAYYFKNNFLQDENNSYTANSVISYNYTFFPNELKDINSFFECLCRNNHTSFVELFINSEEIYSYVKSKNLTYAVENNNIDIINILLSCPNIDVNAIKYSDMTALKIAIKNKNKEIVKSLLSHPNINVNDNSYGYNQSILYFNILIFHHYSRQLKMKKLLNFYYHIQKLMSIYIIFF